MSEPGCGRGSPVGLTPLSLFSATLPLLSTAGLQLAGSSQPWLSPYRI